jgi:hypothetical protein
MSKITNVRLPNAAPVQYSAESFDQLVRSLEQVIFQLNNSYTPTVSDDKAGAGSWFAAGSGAGGGFAGGVRGFQISNGISLPQAMLISNLDQDLTSTTTEELLTYDVVALSNGIRVVDNTKIYVPCSGQYLVTFTLQVSNRSNAVQEFEVWAKDTGVNYPSSRTRFDIAARKDSSTWAHIVPAITGIFTVNDPSTNYLQIAWWASSTDVFLEHYAAESTPTRPEIPSVILTINFVSAV